MNISFKDAIFLAKELLLSQKEYTLTVVTNPASASCTLTCDGVSYNSKTATVKKGTVISYYIYQSTYGSTSGSITMDGDKTLICTGTYSPTTTDVSWSSPTNMTSNSTSSFSLTPSGEYSSYYAWKAFDNDVSTMWCPANSYSPANVYLIMYSSTPIKLRTIYITNSNGSAPARQSVSSASISGSSNGSSYTSLGSGSNSNTTKAYTWSFSSSTSSYYKYFKLELTKMSGQGYLYIPAITISGYYQSTSYVYYWSTSITSN